jgi:mannosyltransferase
VGRPLRRTLATARAHPELIVLGAIVALGAALRFTTLGVQSFDSGETVTAARILHSGFGDTFTAVATVERSGPLYYALAWAWAHGFGTGEVALRSLSAIFGTATSSGTRRRRAPTRS